MEVWPTVMLGALVWKFVDFLKYLRAADWNGVGTQIVAWVAGVGAVFLVAQTEFAHGIDVGGRALSVLPGWDLLVLGLMATSLLSAAYDVKKSIDNSDSAAVPPLFKDGGEA